MSQQFRECVRQMIIKLKFIPENLSNKNAKKISTDTDKKIHHNSQNVSGFAPILFEKKQNCSNVSTHVSIEKGTEFYCIKESALINSKLNTNNLIKSPKEKPYKRNLITISNNNSKTITHIEDSGCCNDSENEDDYDKIMYK